MQDFYSMARQIHNNKVRDEYLKNKSLEYIVNVEYSIFCCWCRAFNKEENEINFKLYQKQENKSINFWVKKRIAELFFNYNFEYDYENKKWKYKKIVK